MRYLFIGLLVISFIGTGVAWYLKRSNNDEGFLKGALSSVGIKQKESVHRQRMNELNKQNIKGQEALYEDVGDQERFLEESNTRLQTIVQIARESMDKNDGDLLRLQSTMEGLQNQNRLLIERGKELVKANQEQLKLRMNNLDKASLSSIDTEINLQRFESTAENLLSARRDYMNAVEEQSKLINDNVIEIKDKLKNLSEKGTMSQSSPLNEKLDSLAQQSDELLMKIRDNQQRIKDRVESSRQKLADAKEHLKDVMDSKEQLFADTQERNIERTRTLNDRSRDQMEKLRQQANY